jgi:hypothetical protein
LYADTVLIPNFFADYAPETGHPPDLDSENFRQDLVDDVKVLLSLRPVIEAGFVVPFTPPQNACPGCLAMESFGAEAGQRYSKMFRKLKQDYTNKLEATIERQFDEYYLSCTAPEALLEHGTAGISYVDLPDPIAKAPSIVKR